MSGEDAAKYAPGVTGTVYQIDPRVTNRLERMHVSLVDAAKNGPVVLFFLNSRSPKSVEFAEAMTVVEKAVSGHSAVIGVIDLEEKPAYDWNRDHAPKVDIVSDPFHRFYEAYKVTSGGTIVLVEKGGKMVGRYAPASYADLGDIATKLSEMTGAKISFGLPSATNLPIDGKPLNQG